MEKAPDFISREDKLTKYLENLSKDFLFDELSATYIESNELDFMKGVAVPFKPADMVALNESGIDPARIVDNMAIVLGSNIKFPYASQYIKFMAKYFNEKLIGVFTSKAAEFMMTGKNYRTALAYYRMALMLDSSDTLSLFGYACGCREWYLSLEGEDDVDELIETLKSESTEYFEWSIIEHPEFAPAYYYLGFAYLNADLYNKAQFIWMRFVELSPDKEKKEVREIQERIAELDDPCKIESAINDLTTGNLEAGLTVLESYVGSRYDNWWPLHFYLASTYRELEKPAEAIEGFKKVLKLNPSNYDACKALAEIYSELNDAENGMKYAKKCELILQNQN